MCLNQHEFIVLRMFISSNTRSKVLEIHLKLQKQFMLKENSDFNYSELHIPQSFSLTRKKSTTCKMRKSLVELNPSGETAASSTWSKWCVEILHLIVISPLNLLSYVFIISLIELLDPSLMEKEMSLKVIAKRLAWVCAALAES